MINDIVFKGKRSVNWKDVREYIKQYVGDGGSMELETAAKVVMHPAQAVWYLKAGTKTQSVSDRFQLNCKNAIPQYN